MKFNYAMMKEIPRMKEMTKAEEQIMQILWELKQAFVQEIVDRMPDPKPAYNTVSTIVRILQEKGIVSHQVVGRGHRYYPLIEREAYSHYQLKHLIGNYFDHSFSQMLSFFTRKEKIDVRELEQVLREIKTLQDDQPVK